MSNSQLPCFISMCFESILLVLVIVGALSDVAVSDAVVSVEVFTSVLVRVSIVPVLDVRLVLVNSGVSTDVVPSITGAVTLLLAVIVGAVTSTDALT